jgi:hypothetical protein
MVGETIQERKLKNTVSFDKLEMHDFSFWWTLIYQPFGSDVHLSRWLR